MHDPRKQLTAVLREAIDWLARPDNEFVWSHWDNADEAVAELRMHIEAIEGGALPPKHDLEILFAPTGSIQEVSVSSGWGDAFIALASRFDEALQRAYR